MWWRIALAAFSSVLALSMAAVLTGLVSVSVTLESAAIQSRRPPTILGQPPIFYIALVIIVLTAMPLAIRLLRGRPGPKA
jgi:hypothetical protein